MTTITETQAELCRRVGADHLPAKGYQKLGLAEQTLGAPPINGLRHSPAGETSGWYIWAGEELGTNDKFFQPIHVRHLVELLPQVQPYLALPAGWRFLLAEGHEDVWFDSSLLETS
jgi:hypothetical protein